MKKLFAVLCIVLSSCSARINSPSIEAQKTKPVVFACFTVACILWVSGAVAAADGL